MTAFRLAIAIGGAAVALWWMTRRRRVGPRSPRKRLSVSDLLEALRWWSLGPVSAVVAGLAGANAAAVIAIGLAAGGSTRLFRLMIDARRITERTESISRLCGLLANQASARPTVPSAIEAAAEWASGSVEQPTRRLAAEVRSAGIERACARFVEDVGHPLAKALSDVLVEAHQSGAPWVDAVHTLSVQAHDTTESMRLLVREVASKMPMLVLTAGIGAGMLGGLTVLMPDTAAWYSSTNGQLMVLVTGAAYAAICYQIVTRARREMRR